MNNNFIYDDGYIIGIEGETIKADYSFNYNGLDLRIIVSEMNKEDSYKQRFDNVYILNPYMREEVLNCLNHQTDIKPKEHYTKKWAEIIVLQYYLWFKYGNPDEDTVLSFSIEEVKE